MPCNALLYLQIQSIRTYFTRNNTRNFFYHHSQTKTKTIKLSNNYHQSDGFLFHFPKGYLSKALSFHFYYWESKTFIPLAQIKSSTQVAYLAFKGKVYWNVTSHKPSFEDISRWMEWNWFLSTKILASYVSTEDLMERPSANINIKNKLSKRLILPQKWRKDAPSQHFYKNMSYVCRHTPLLPPRTSEFSYITESFRS